MGAEYGNAPPLVSKWKEDLKIKINGNPSSKDKEILNQVINELNYLLEGKIKIYLVDTNQNVDINFVPLSDFYLCNAVEGNLGFVTCYWNDNVIYKANICIATDKYISQEIRSHNIREQLASSLGLLNDSWKYKDSIFYQGYSETQYFTEIDQKIIIILYEDKIKPGMSKDNILKIFYPRSISNYLLELSILGLFLSLGAGIYYLKKNKNTNQNKKYQEHGYRMHYEETRETDEEKRQQAQYRRQEDSKKKANEERRKQSQARTKQENPRYSSTKANDFPPQIILLLQRYEIDMSKQVTLDIVKKKRKYWLELLHPDKNTNKSEETRKLAEDKLKEMNDVYKQLRDYFKNDLTN